MKQLLEEIIRTENIRIVFQPIVSLIDAEILGYEALSRGPSGSILERPDMLFKTAIEHNMLWELEYLCRLKALEKAKHIAPSKMLFINIDPKVMNNEKSRRGFAKEFMDKSNIDPMNIIFEITERTSIEDYKTFRKSIENYINQGFRIAIDDTGSGYSGLKMLAETHPHYIKLDMDLIRDIDKKPLNQALVKALLEFANSSNIKIIAEGIETSDELNTLIRFGIHYGQGYLLQKPSPEFLQLNPSVKSLIVQKQVLQKKQYVENFYSIPIGEIARLDTPINPSASKDTVNEMFTCNTAIQGIPVVENEIPMGLIMRNDFYLKLLTQYGEGVSMNCPIKLLMNNNPLIVDYNMALAQVSKTAMTRREEELYDYIIITRDNKYYGIATVKSLLENITLLELNNAKHSNPLTGLPGNLIIEQNIKNTLDLNEDKYIIYFDIDNFKTYNDAYGFENGDKIIVLTANIIKERLKTNYYYGNFLGHIGANSFIAIAASDDIEKTCSDIIQAFDDRIKNYYTEADINNGYITTMNRRGIAKKFPIISLSIAVVDNRKHKYESTVELSKQLSILKKKCKLKFESNYCIY